MSEETKETPPAKRPYVRKMWRTKAREAITPYLPPPAIQAMSQLDAQLEPTVGPEATVTLGATLLTMWLTLSFVRMITRRLGGRGRAIAGEDDDHVLSASAMKGEQFDKTVLFCGPQGGGKTRLFYYFCTGDKNLPTLTSLKANVGIPKLDTEPGGGTEIVRYLDWPGHATLNDKALDTVWSAPLPDVRVVLVLDATQKVSAAAATLYEIWQEAAKTKRRRQVLIACHKKDFPKAKNWKRIKIQLRTELERLVTTKKPEWWSASREVELDSLPELELYFCSTTCEGNGLVPLEVYCRQGKLPEQEE